MAQGGHLRPVEGAGRPSDRSEFPSMRTFTKIAGGEVIRVSVETFQGHHILNLRTWYRGGDGQMRFCEQGIALRAELLPELSQAIAPMMEAEGMGDDM